MTTDTPVALEPIVTLGPADLELEVWVRPKDGGSIHLVGTIDATGEDRFRDGEALLTELRSAMAEVYEHLGQHVVEPIIVEVPEKVFGRITVHVGDQPLDPRINPQGMTE